MGGSKAKQGKKSAKEDIALYEQIAECFDKGFTQRRAIKALDGHKFAVESHYKILKTKKLEEIDNEFINKQKVTKEIATNVVDERIAELDILRAELESRLGEILDKGNGIMLGQYLRTIELISTLENRKFSYMVTPTADVTLGRLIEDMKENARPILPNDN